MIHVPSGPLVALGEGVARQLANAGVTLHGDIGAVLVQPLVLGKVNGPHSALA